MNSPMEGQPETVRYRPQRDRDNKLGEEAEVTESSRDGKSKAVQKPMEERRIFFFLKEAMAGK